MPTVPSTLRATARRVPEAVAIKFGDFSCTYAELDAEVDRTAHALSALGLDRGDRFALMATQLRPLHRGLLRSAAGGGRVDPGEPGLGAA